MTQDIIKWLADQLAVDPNVDPAIAEFISRSIHQRGSDRWQEVRDEETGPDDDSDD